MNDPVAIVTFCLIVWVAIIIKASKTEGGQALGKGLISAFLKRLG